MNTGDLGFTCLESALERSQEPGIRWQEIEIFRAGFLLGSNDGVGGRIHAPSCQPQLDKAYYLLPYGEPRIPQLWEENGHSQSCACARPCAWGGGWWVLDENTGAL